MECLLEGLLLPFIPDGRFSFSCVDIDLSRCLEDLGGLSTCSTLSEAESLEDVFSIARLEDFSDLCFDDLFSSLSLRGGDSTAGHFSFSRLDLDLSFLDDFGSGGGVKGGSGTAGGAGGGGGGIGAIGGGGGGTTISSSLGRRFLLFLSFLGASSTMAIISFSSSSSGNVPGTSDSLRCLLGRSLSCAMIGSSAFFLLLVRSSREDSFLATGGSSTSSPYCKSSTACSTLAASSFLATRSSSAAFLPYRSAGFTSLSESDAGGGDGGRVGRATSSGASWKALRPIAILPPRERGCSEDF